jgi:hypothetical protein
VAIKFTDTQIKTDIADNKSINHITRVYLIVQVIRCKISLINFSDKFSKFAQVAQAPIVVDAAHHYGASWYTYPA